MEESTRSFENHWRLEFYNWLWYAMNPTHQLSLTHSLTPYGEHKSIFLNSFYSLSQLYAIRTMQRLNRRPFLFAGLVWYMCVPYLRSENINFHCTCDAFKFIIIHKNTHFIFLFFFFFLFHFTSSSAYYSICSLSSHTNFRSSSTAPSSLVEMHRFKLSISTSFFPISSSSFLPPLIKQSVTSMKNPKKAPKWIGKEKKTVAVQNAPG